MKNFFLYFSTILIFTTLGSLNTFSEEKFDSTVNDYRKDMQSTIYASADFINNGLNMTLGAIGGVEIYNNKYIPVTAFYEANFSIPMIKDSSINFSCLNAGLKFRRKITDTWSLSMNFSSGIALYDQQYSINSVLRVELEYRGISIFTNMRSIISKNSNASIAGFGIAYTIY